MRVRVLFFGQLKEIVGRSEDHAEVADGARLEDLFASYGRRYPKLAGFRHSVVASVNQSLADWASPLSMGDEVAFLPPVSGGAGSPAVAAYSLGGTGGRGGDGGFFSGGGGRGGDTGPSGTIDINLQGG